MDTFFRDIRIGFRVLLKERSFCALAVTVLALGICGVTAMFSVVNGVMLRGFSFPNADRLVAVSFIDPTSANAFGVNNQVSALDYQEFKGIQKSYDLMAGYLNGSTVNVSYNGQPKRYTDAYVTEDFLRILGVAPVMGRDFTAADNVAGAEKVTLIGYGMWQRDFGGKADITRFKGLGEMQSVHLRETTMDPTRRVLLKVDVPTAASAGDRREEMRVRTLVEDLMGRKPEKRYAFITENAKFARDLDV